MSSRDVCSMCETNYVLQDDARCGICAECEAVLDSEAPRRRMPGLPSESKATVGEMVEMGSRQSEAPAPDQIAPEIETPCRECGRAMSANLQHQRVELAADYLPKRWAELARRATK